MKKIIMLLVVMNILLILPACSARETEEISLLDEKQVKTFDYKELETIKNNFVVDTYEIDVPSECQINTFCLFDDTMYYSLDYTKKFDNPTGAEPEISFENEYNTQIRSYNKKNNEDILIYQYSEDQCIEVTDMQSNGTYLVWEDYMNDGRYDINYMTLNSNNKPESITTREEGKEGLTTLTLTITNDNLYWYELSNDSDGYYNLRCYDFKTKTIDVKNKELSLSSPFEHVNIINGIFTTYKKEEDDITVINIYDSTKKTNIDLKVSGDISNPMCNGEICIWMTGYDYEDREYLFIYDLSENSIEKIPVSYAFSYGINEDLVLVNQENGMYFYDIKNRTYECLIETEYTSNGYIHLGLSNNLYVEKFGNSNKLEVINYKRK